MITVDKIIPGGTTLATAPDGKKLFLWGALPGETVLDYNITKNKSHYTEAIATQIANPSPHRVTERDKCYLSTSAWQIMDYGYELELKRDLVTELFREHHISIPTPEIFTDGKDYFYRNKMEYALYWDNDTNRIELAFHQRGSHRKIPITSSSIERPEIFKAAAEIIADLNSHHEPARKYQSLLLRCSQNGTISGGLYENGRPHPTFKNLTDTILGQEYSYSPNGFFQINLPVYELALTEIKKYITTDEVLDLYAGVGTIGLSVAPDKQLTLVECNKSAFLELKRNCIVRSGDPREAVRVTGVGPLEVERSEDSQGDTRQDPNTSATSHSARPVLLPSEDALNYITSSNTVILDPPRAGCDRKLIDHLLQVTPPTIIYLSCNPATQARDAALLLEKYHITAVHTFNFFPRTPHIENLIVLSL